MACCATGPCDKSAARGGPGCYLCDVITQLPQPYPQREPRLTTKEGRKTVGSKETNKKREEALW